MPHRWVSMFVSLFLKIPGSRNRNNLAKVMTWMLLNSHSPAFAEGSQKSNAEVEKEGMQECDWVNSIPKSAMFSTGKKKKSEAIFQTSLPWMWVRTIIFYTTNQGKKQRQSYEAHSFTVSTPISEPVIGRRILAFHHLRDHETSEWDAASFRAPFITIPSNLKFIMNANNNQFVNTIFKFTRALLRYSF